MKNTGATLLMSMVLCVSCAQSPQKGSVIQFGVDISEDATYAVLSEMEALAGQEDVNITFEKGEYHFWPEKAREQFCYISNHNDVLSRIAFLIKDQKGMTIDGNGSKFIFHGRLIPFWMENSEDIEVKNLTIDFAESFHSEGTIVAKDEKAKTFDMQISEEYPYIIKNDQLVFIKPYYSHNLGQAIMYDPKTNGIAYRTELYTPLSTWGRLDNSVGIKEMEYKYKVDKNDVYINKFNSQSPLKVEQLKPGLVRISGHNRLLPEVGMVLASKGDQTDNRLTPGFKVNNVTDFYAENVTLNHAGGMGFLFENCDNVDLYKCNIIPSEGRMVSTTADATHFVGCRGKVSLRDCVFKNQLDDASNVHGSYQEVMDILDNHTLGLRVGHYQQLGFALAKPGDTVGVVRLSESFDAYDKLTVKEVEFINGRYQRISFEEEVPSRLQTGDLLENLSAYPEVLVENCNISKNRARGLLISTPKKTVIRNNYFETEMTALLLPVESGHWFESGNACNVTIENNTFQDCAISGHDIPVITFETDDESDNIAFNNILIKGNTFNHFDNYILRISNVDGLKFIDNKITNSGTYPMQFPNNPVVKIQYSKNIEFKGNTYQGKAAKMIETLKGMPEVVFE